MRQSKFFSHFPYGSSVIYKTRSGTNEKNIETHEYTFTCIKCIACCFHIHLWIRMTDKWVLPLETNERRSVNLLQSFTRIVLKLNAVYNVMVNFIKTSQFPSLRRTLLHGSCARARKTLSEPVHAPFTDVCTCVWSLHLDIEMRTCRLQTNVDLLCK